MKMYLDKLFVRAGLGRRIENYYGPYYPRTIEGAINKIRDITKDKKEDFVARFVDGDREYRMKETTWLLCYYFNRVGYGGPITLGDIEKIDEAIWMEMDRAKNPAEYE